MLNAALIGVGGFGYCHLLSLQKLCQEQRIALKAVCDVNPSFRKDFVERGIAFFEDYREMLEQIPALDYVAVSTPIHTHTEIAEECFRRGINVLLEKPPAILPEEYQRLTTAMVSSGKACAVNYTMTADPSFQRLMQMLKSQELGQIHTIIGMGLSRRYQSYYSGSPWLGKLAYKGYTLRDGTINNPLSHLLNNMLFLANAADGGNPASVEAELYHVYPISGEDTSCMRITTRKGLNLLFYATLCHDQQENAQIQVIGSRGSALWRYYGYLKTAAGEESYPAEENPTDKIHENLCDFLEKKIPLFCSLKDCHNTILTADAAFASASEITAIPESFVKVYQENGESGRALIDIKRHFQAAAEQGRLFSEIGLPWAASGKKIIL